MPESDKLPKSEMIKIGKRLELLKVSMDCGSCGGKLGMDNILRVSNGINFKNRQPLTDTFVPMVRLICFDCTRSIYFDYIAMFKDDKSDFSVINS